MKKINLSKQVLVSVVGLFVFVVGVFLYSSCGESEKSTGARNTTGYYGNEHAPVHLIVLIPSEARYFSQEVKRVQDVLQMVLESYLKNDLIYIRTVPEPESDDQRVRYFKVLSESEHLSILISPFEGAQSKYMRQLSAELKIPYLFFSRDESSVCTEEVISPVLWNLGVTTSMYVEPYLAHLNQRFVKLASDLRFFFYVNENQVSSLSAQVFKKLIEELGFVFTGAVAVDERYDDLYTTIREIFGKTPDVLIGFTTPGGRHNFFPQSFKLGLNLEMGIALEYGIEEEELRLFGKNAEGTIVPVTYVADYVSSQNNVFKEQLESIAGEKTPTMASYKGFLLAKVLDMSFSKMKFEKEGRGEEAAEHFLSALESLDNSKILTPSGVVLLNAPVHGLIQPMHIAEFKDGFLRHSQYLGDVAQSRSELCGSSAR